MPDKFVLKSNHSSGQVIVCTDKNKFDWNNAIHVMRGWLKDNYYYNRAEWQYKDIQPRLFAEELLAVDIMDYRIFCCSGQVVFIRATVHDPESKTGWAVGVYDKEWNPCECHQPNDTAIVVDKPQCLDEMVYIAEKLSEDFGFVRVDLYNVNQKPYFAELTFTPNSGIYFFEPKEWDLKLGQMSNIKIRE